MAAPARRHRVVMELASQWAGRITLLKTSQFKRICPTQACTKPFFKDSVLTSVRRRHQTTCFCPSAARQFPAALRLPIGYIRLSSRSLDAGNADPVRWAMATVGGYFKFIPRKSVVPPELPSCCPRAPYIYWKTHRCALWRLVYVSTSLRNGLVCRLGRPVC